MRILLLRFSHLLFWTALLLLILAMAGPTRTIRERIFLTRGLDIIFVVDQSPTMAATDVQPGNRLDAARTVIRRFVEQRDGDHIGVVGFSRDAALRVPITLDHQRVIETLETMYLMEYGDGTAIGLAIALATLHLQSSDGERRIIILLTDGVNNAGEISPEAAAELARQAGIRLYAIGIGSEQEVEIEFHNPEDGRVYRGTVRDSYDAARLSDLAERSGGRFFEAASGGTLEAILNAIGSAEETERRVRTRVRREPEHRSLLLIALFLLLGDVLLRRLLLGVEP
jgi:Ca-activated chloride channel family protein